MEGLCNEDGTQYYKDEYGMLGHHNSPYKLLFHDFFHLSEVS